MKSGKIILSNILKKSHFVPIRQQECYRKFVELLPIRFQSAVAFVYIKNETFFIALSHPGYKMEFNYNKELFKTLLASISKNIPSCQNLKVEKIAIFNSKIHTIDKKQDTGTVPYYSELSSGNFDTDTLDNETAKIFLDIKEIIAKNLNNGK